MTTTLAPPTASPAPRPLVVPVIDPATSVQHYMREDWLFDSVIYGFSHRAACGAGMVAQTSAAPTGGCGPCVSIRDCLASLR